MAKKFTIAAALISIWASPAFAIDFNESENGRIEFDMPSGNICCSFNPDNPDVVMLSCTRVEPKYWIVNLTSDGKMSVYKNPGEVPGCGYGEPLGNVFDYGTSWKKSGVKCTSSTRGLKCTANGKGFKLSRAGLVKY